jgi:3-oxoacyl-[acyl-carrier-protein] synthase II
MAFISAMAHLTASGLNGDPGGAEVRIQQIPKPEVSGRRRLRFARLDRLSQLSLTTAAAAMARAQERGAPRPQDEAQAGAALGTAFGAHLSNEQFQAGLMDEGQSGASPALFPYTLPSTAVGELSLHLGLMGPLITLAQGPGSGLAALASAASQVDRGQAHWMLAGGADSLGETLQKAAAGAGVGELAEGAVFFVLSAREAGALARVDGWASATGEDASRRAARQVCSSAEAVTEISGGGQVCGAQVPLLVLAQHLESGLEQPLCLTWDHGDGSASALLLS